MKPTLAALALAAAVSHAQTEDECGTRDADVWMGSELRRAGLWQPDSYRDPFTLGPVRDSEDGQFTESDFRQGRAALTLRVAADHRWEPRGVHLQLARTIASLPGLAVQRLPRVSRPYREFGIAPAMAVTMHAGEIPGAGDAAGVAWTGSDGPYGVGLRNAVSLDNDGAPVLQPWVGKALLHEFAHVFDNRIAYESAGGTIPDGEPLHFSAGAAWQRAMSESPCAVSDYAANDAQEDFAESVVAWFLFYAARVPYHVEEPEDWRYRRYLRSQRQQRAALRRDYKQRLGRRFGVLNRVMHARFADPPPSQAIGASPPRLAPVVERIPLGELLGVQR